jgi:hypothetical protein
LLIFEQWPETARHRIETNAANAYVGGPLGTEKRIGRVVGLKPVQSASSDQRGIVVTR